MKKIVIFNPSIEGGGVERNLEIIANYLSKKTKRKIYLISYDKCLKLNKTVNFVKPIINLNIKNRIFKYFICLISLIIFHINNKKYLIFSFQANVYAILFAKLFKQKIIVRANAAPHGWINGYKKIIIKFFYKRADKVIVNSNEFRNEFKKTFQLNPTVIYNPLDKVKLISLSKKKINIPFFDYFKSGIKILNVGRLTSQKNQIDILRSVNILKNKIPIRLLIIGTGNKLSYLKNFIKEENLSNNVKIIPYCKNPYNYFKKADMFILSSKYEGLPNVLLEATLFKLLSISYKCKTGPKEILQNGKGGILVNFGDHKRIAKEILKYFYSKKKYKYKKMIDTSYKNLKKYHLKRQLNKYEKITNNHLK